MLKSFLFHNLIEAGCDEAGRGCLAGPVSAAAVILPRNFRHPVLNDSKKLTARQRDKLYQIIINHCLAYGLGQGSVEEIDSIGILPATRLAMQRAVEALSPPPDALIIDGFNGFGYTLAELALKQTAPI